MIHLFEKKCCKPLYCVLPREEKIQMTKKLLSKLEMTCIIKWSLELPDVELPLIVQDPIISRSYQN